MNNLAELRMLRNPPREELVTIPIELIQKNQSLAFPIYLIISGRPVLFRIPGDQLTTGRAGRLKNKVETVSVPREALSMLGGGMPRLLPSPEQPPTLDYASDLRNILFAISCEVDSRKTTQNLQVSHMRSLASELAEALYRRPALGASLIKRYGDSSLYYVSHTMNVAVYGIMMGIKLGLTLESLKMLAFGSLVHNIGNIFVPDSILFKSGSLTLSEWRIIQEHPLKGGAFFEALEAPNEVIHMIQHHHERIDGNGYPFALTGNQISLFSRVCTIADVFDALTSKRPYRQAISPFEAIQVMREMKGKFDPNILKVIEG